MDKPEYEWPGPAGRPGDAFESFYLETMHSFAGCFCRGVDQFNKKLTATGLNYVWRVKLAGSACRVKGVKMDR